MACGSAPLQKGINRIRPLNRRPDATVRDYDLESLSEHIERHFYENLINLPRASSGRMRTVVSK